MSIAKLHGLLVLGYSVTPLHPGSGRAPGAVDQVVQKDPLGYPIVFASSVKGAFKAECARRVAQICNRDCFDEGRIKCSESGSTEESKELACELNCRICCCLFGSEPSASEQEAGLFSVLDFIPLFFPIPSLSEGYVYLTTPYLVKRALAILDVVNSQDLETLRKFLEEVVSNEDKLTDNKVLTTITNKHEIYVSTTKFFAESITIQDQNLSLLEKCGPLAKNLRNKIVVMSDANGPIYVEKGMIRVTRIRLRLDTKTVSEGGLWTEEYIPQGTIFLGGFVVPNPVRKNSYCPESVEPIDVLRKTLGNVCETYAVIGGKETIGRGMIKLKLHPCGATA